MKRNPHLFRRMDSHRFITRIDHTTKNIMTLCKDLILVWKLYLQLTPWNRVLPEKLTSPQSRNSPHFMEPERSLPHSQEPATCPYPEPDLSSSGHPIPLLLRSILILSSHLSHGLLSRLFPSDLPAKTLYAPLVSSVRPTCLTYLILLSLITQMIFGE
jgi:hypothetical protein